MDEPEFAALYAALRDPLFAYAASRLAPQEALDVVHDTFEVVWKKRAAVPAAPDELRAWCYGVARNKISQHQRRQGRREPFVAPPPSQDPGELVAAADHAREVWGSLSPADREVLAVALSTDASGQEISMLLGVSYSSATSRMSRARRRLAGLLHSPDPLIEEVTTP
jgi:RNA polymerase sigma-70 factor (ECF subfamily)